MRQVVRFAAVAAVLGLAFVAAPDPASAQSWTLRDVWAQRDRPGDWRCDAYWNANRDDCGVAWRDQRHRTTLGRYRSHDSDGRWTREPSRHAWSRHGRTRASGEAWYGAYGRPDLIHSSGATGRDLRLIDACRARYRSYDPASGYYRAYSGRLVFCG